MGPERIEQILKEHFPQGEPPGAREHILARALQEVRPAKSRVSLLVKCAFAVAVGATMLLANASDRARQERLTHMVRGNGGIAVTDTPASAGNPAQWTQEMERLIALSSSEDVKKEGSL